VFSYLLCKDSVMITSIVFFLGEVGLTLLNDVYGSLFHLF
jgi:hypothetical protein